MKTLKGISLISLGFLIALIGLAVGIAQTHSEGAGTIAAFVVIGIGVVLIDKGMGAW